jgi:hypothetical protein
MSSLDPDEIKRLEVHVVKCPKCKLTVKVKLSEKKCPKCKYTLNRPSPEVIEKLRTLYREREHYNTALDGVLAQIERDFYLPPSERVPAERERERNTRSLVEVSAQINKLLEAWWRCRHKSINCCRNKSTIKNGLTEMVKSHCLTGYMN